MYIRYILPFLLLFALPALAADTTISGSITFSTGLQVTGNRVSVGAPSDAILLGYDASLGGFQNVTLGSNLSYSAGVLSATEPGGNVSLNASALIEAKPNGGLGTLDNKLVVYVPSSATVEVASVTDTHNVIGVCVPGGITNTSCGVSGTAAIGVAGQVNCTFDNPPTAGDFIVASTTTAGDCHDAGSSLPTEVQIIGFAQVTNVSVGTYPIDLSDMGVAGALFAKAQPGGSSGQVQYNNNGDFGGVSGSVCDSNGNCGWGGTQTFSSVLGTVTTLSNAITAYTLAASDCGTEINTTANALITVTVPSTLPAGCNVAIRQGGSGSATLVAGAGATLNSPHNFTKTYAQFSIIGISVATNVGGSAAVADFTGDGS